jgi:lipopolysaccharide/colanic/teichoic acid biosynthesis glycosyltransferase
VYIDVLIACGALLVAFLLRGNFSLADTAPRPLLEALALAGASAAVAFRLTGTNIALWRYVTVRDLGTLLAGASAAVLAFVALMFLWNRLETIPRGVPVIQWLTLVVSLCGVRLVYAATFGATARPRPPEVRTAWEPVLLVGGGQGAAAIARFLHVIPEIGWTPVGILDERPIAGRMLDNVPILGRTEDLRRVLGGLELRGMRPRRILLTESRDGLGVEIVRRLEHEAEREGLGVLSVPDLLQAQARPELAASSGKQCLHGAVARLEHGSYRAGKRLLDVAVSAAVLGLTAPLMAAIALALRLGVGAPVLFHQVRGGRGAQPFVMVKFRTMAETYGPDGRLLPDGERTPWIGRLLRRTRLDELPQFWNVLVGNMSIVGPRPLVAAELALLSDGGAERSAIRPGITGWAQVHGGQLLDLPAKAALDLWYARHTSLALDLRILLLTVRMVVRGERLDAPVLDRVEAAHAEARQGRGVAWASAR